jgi:hypothetical protein
MIPMALPLNTRIIVPDSMTLDRVIYMLFISMIHK